MLKQQIQKDLKNLSDACFDIENKLEIGDYVRQRLYRVRYEIGEIEIVFV